MSDGGDGVADLIGSNARDPPTYASLTASLPLVLDDACVVTSDYVNLLTQTTGTMPVSRGGTGSIAALAGNRVMLSSAAQSILEGSALTNGQLLIGSTAAAPVAGSLTAGSTSIVVTPGAGTLSINTAQPIAVSDSPTWSDITDTGLTASTWVCANAAKKLISQTLAGTTDQVILTGAAGSGSTVLSLPQSIATTSGPTFSDINLTTGTLKYTTFASFLLPSSSSSDTLAGVSIFASLTNKRFDDATCMFAHKFDATKLLKFNCVSQATGTTYSIAPSITTGRTLTLPDATGVALVDTDTTARTISSTWTLSNAPVISALTASRPLKLTAGKVVTASQIDLASANDVTGILPAASVQPASATDPGIVNTGAQSFPSGRKTFTDQLECFELYTNGTLYVQQSTNQVQLGLNPGNRITITAPAPAASRTYTVPDAGANCEFIMAAGSQNISGTKGFSLAVPIFATTNQLALGTTNTTTINSTAPSASRVVTLPDAGANSSFVLTESAQTINGAKTFSAAIPISATSNQLILGTTNRTTISSTAPAANRTVTLPDAGANSSFVLTELAQTINGAKTFGSAIDATAAGVKKGNFAQRTNNTVINCPNSAFTTLTWDTAVNSNGITYAAGVFTCPLPGVYLVTFNIRYAGLGIAYDAGVYSANNNDSVLHGFQSISNSYVCSSSLHYLPTANKTINCGLFQNSGSAVNTAPSAAAFNTVFIQMISAL